MASLQVDHPVEVVTDQAEEKTQKSPTCEEALFSPIDHHQDIVNSECKSTTAEYDMEVEELEEVVVPDEEKEEIKPAAKEEKQPAPQTCTSCTCNAKAATGPTHCDFTEEEEEEEGDHED